MPGQTLSEIRGLLAAAGLAPQHRLGQNFLVDLNLMRKLVDAAELDSRDTVLEVGPGTGSLTELLLVRGVRVVAVELDHGLCRVLRERLGAERRFTLIEGDALSSKHAVNPEVRARLRGALCGAEHGGRLKLVANLPYQVATPLLIDLLCDELPFACLCATIQKEVADRLVAPCRSEAYGPASVVVQVTARVETIAALPPEAFWPRPQVHSSMLRLMPRTDTRARVGDPAAFARFVAGSFQQRRKVLRSVLRARVAKPEGLLESLGISATARAEELTPADWERLFRASGTGPRNAPAWAPPRPG